MAKRNSQDEDVRSLERAYKESPQDPIAIRRYLVARARQGDTVGGLPCPFCFEPDETTVYPDVDYFSCSVCGLGSSLLKEPTRYLPCDACGSHNALDGEVLCPTCKKRLRGKKNPIDEEWRRLRRKYMESEDESDRHALWMAVQRLGEEELPCFTCGELYSAHSEPGERSEDDPGETCPASTDGWEEYYCTEETWLERDVEWNPRRNPADEDLRKLERQAKEGDERAKALLVRHRKRLGQESLEDQLAEARREIEFANGPDGFHKIAFPEATRWADLFEDWMPTTEDQVVKVPAKVWKAAEKVKHPGSPWRVVRDYLDSVGVGMDGESLSIQIEEREATLTRKHEAPYDWTPRIEFEEDERSRTGRVRRRRAFLEIGSYCSIRDGSYRSIFVKPRAEVADWLSQNLLLIEDETFFNVILRASEEHANTILVTCDYNKITGSRWLAILPALELPR